MGIFSENTIPSFRTPASLVRLGLIAAAVALAVTCNVLGIHGNRHTAGAAPSKPAAPAQARASRHNLHFLHKVQPWHQLGLASWYGEQFQGKQTANGEIFDMNGLTCAHRTLPLGTWIKVTNMHTRKWIVVRVNDRGPVPETRIADLSSEAAHMLGMRSRGVTRVRLDLIDPRRAVQIARLEQLRVARDLADTPPQDAGN
jgi:rare lipoprotein A